MYDVCYCAFNLEFNVFGVIARNIEERQENVYDTRRNSILCRTDTVRRTPITTLNYLHMRFSKNKLIMYRTPSPSHTYRAPTQMHSTGLRRLVFVQTASNAVVYAHMMMHMRWVIRSKYIHTCQPVDRHRLACRVSPNDDDASNATTTPVTVAVCVWLGCVCTRRVMLRVPPPPHVIWRAVSVAFKRN